MEKKNYQKELDKIIEGLAPGERPTLFLHSCCAPCSSYVLEYLTKYFRITDFYYNPNIAPESECRKRSAELQRLIAELPADNPVTFVEGPYEPEKFREAVRGLEHIPEGGERCRKCFELRLGETAKRAAEGGYDHFATTLTISPLKSAAVLNEVAGQMGEKYKVKPLPSDFKKRGGYQRSVELSKIYGLYRQDYCGCAYSKAERERTAGENGNN